MFFASVVGFTLGPLCVGMLSDAFTASLGKEALRYALLAPVGLIPFIVIALREAAKVADTWPAFRSKHFDEPLDGLVYAASAALAPRGGANFPFAGLADSRPESIQA